MNLWNSVFREAANLSVLRVPQHGEVVCNFILVGVGQNELGLAGATLWVDGWSIEDGKVADEKAGSYRIELGAVIGDCLVVVVECLVNNGDSVVAESFMKFKHRSSGSRPFISNSTGC